MKFSRGSAEARLPLSVQNVTFYRKLLVPKDSKVKVKESPVINLLIVTARPNEEDDVNYRTIQRPLIDLIRNAQLKVIPHILRPGTFQSLSNHLTKEKDRAA